MKTFLEVVKLSHENMELELNTGFLPKHIRLRSHVELYLDLVLGNITHTDITHDHHELCLCDTCVNSRGDI